MKLATVKRVYGELNALNFGGVLTMPRISFTRCSYVDGCYVGDAMEFNLNDTSGLVELAELVYHEMVHQYIAEFLGIVNWDNHNSTFVKMYNKFSHGIEKDKNYEQR